MRPGPPLHVVPADTGHGVARIARQVAGVVGAPVLGVAATMELAPTRVHVHVTDRLFGDSAAAAAETLVVLARHHRTTVTLHDLPQPGDGAAFAGRARAYAAVLAEVDGWVVSSHHEADLAATHLAPGSRPTVVPLPVLPVPTALAGPARPADDQPAVVGVLGWVYPGKGHAEVVRACAGLPVVVRALGRTSPGHDDLLRELVALGVDHGVGFEATGWVPEDELTDQLAEVDVPVAAHRHVSASGSVNSWLAARRRPLVSTGAYAEEMARLRPGTLTLVADDDLAGAVRRALGDPASTRLADDVGTTPHLADTAAAYLAFWAGW